MDKHTEDLLTEVIDLLKQHQPNFFTRESNYYLGRIKAECLNLSKEVARDSCRVFKEGNHYKDKPFKYLLTILQNKIQEEEEEFKKELNRKGAISKTDIVY